MTISLNSTFAPEFDYTAQLKKVSKGASCAELPSILKAVEKPEENKVKTYDIWQQTDVEGNVVAIKQLVPFQEVCLLRGLDKKLVKTLPNKSVWLTVKAESEALNNIPKLDSAYQPSFSHCLKLIDLANRVNKVGYGRAYYGYGEAGCGKTSMALWFTALLGIPVEQFNCSETTVMDDIMVRQVPAPQKEGEEVNNAWISVDGPALRALKKGWWLLVDELDLAPASLPPALNDLVEGHSYAVSGMATQVKANDNFRLLSFGNTGFTCSERGSYNGRNILDASFKSRCIVDKYENLSKTMIQGMLIKNYNCGSDFARSCANFFDGVNKFLESNNSCELLTPRNMGQFVEVALGNNEVVKHPLAFAVATAIPATEEDCELKDSVMSLLTAHFSDVLPNTDTISMWEERYDAFVPPKAEKDAPQDSDGDNASESQEANTMTVNDTEVAIS